VTMHGEPGKKFPFRGHLALGGQQGVSLGFLDFSTGTLHRMGW